MQEDKIKETIKLDQDLVSKSIKIAGLYDPEEYGLNINMWLNSDGAKLINLFESLDKFNLSKDASEILNISLLTNAYYPTNNITEKEFLKFKSDWLIKNSNLELIEEYLIQNHQDHINQKFVFFLFLVFYLAVLYQSVFQTAFYRYQIRIKFDYLSDHR